MSMNPGQTTFDSASLTRVASGPEETPLVPFQFENDQCHSDRREESGDGWNGPTPDASPLRLAQHDIFGAISGRGKRPTYHNQLDAVLDRYNHGKGDGKTSHDLNTQQGTSIQSLV